MPFPVGEYQDIGHSSPSTQRIAAIIGRRSAKKCRGRRQLTGHPSSRPTRPLFIGERRRKTMGILMHPVGRGGGAQPQLFTGFPFASNSVAGSSLNTKSGGVNSACPRAPILLASVTRFF